MKLKHVVSVFLLTVSLAACTTAGSPDLSNMSFSDEPLIGKFVWHDLITEDIDAARRFYGGLFGWEFEASKGPQGNDYTLVLSDNVYIGGMVPVASPTDGTKISRWLPYVSVADVDAAVAAAIAGGATIAASARNVDIGRVAAVIDPQGAVVGLARSDIGDPDDRTTAAAAGRVVWNEMHASDDAAAAAFYKAVINCETVAIERGIGEYYMLRMNGVDRGGIMQNPADGWKPSWLTFFAVTDPEAAAARAAQLGGTVLLRPSQEFRNGNIAVVADPSGAIVVLRKLTI